MQKKMACWKKIYISLGGRITLIKTTMSNVPGYYMSLFKMPTKVVQILEKCKLDFLWEGGVWTRKITW